MKVKILKTHKKYGRLLSSQTHSGSSSLNTFFSKIFSRDLGSFTSVLCVYTSKDSLLLMVQVQLWG